MLTTKSEIIPEGLEKLCAAPANWSRIILREVSSNPEEHLTLYSEWERIAYILHINNAIIEYNPMYVHKCTLAELKKQYRGKPPKVCPYYQEVFSRDTAMSNIRISPLSAAPRNIIPEVTADKSPYVEPYDVRNIRIVDQTEDGTEYEVDDPQLLMDPDTEHRYTESYEEIRRRYRFYSSNLTPPAPKPPSLFARMSATVKQFVKCI